MELVLTKKRLKQVFIGGFVKDFSAIAAPLNKIVEKNVEFNGLL